MATIKGLRKECGVALKKQGDFVLDFKDFCVRALERNGGRITIKPVNAEDRHLRFVARIDTIVPSTSYGVMFANNDNLSTAHGLGRTLYGVDCFHPTTLLEIAEGIQEALSKH